MAMQTYDPTKVTVSVAGIPLTQFAKGNFVTVEYDSDAFTDEVGVGGEVVRVRSADQRATVKVTLMRASPSNDELSALAQLDRLTGQGLGAVQVKDATGTSVHHAEVGWVKKIPSAPYATEAESVEWEIRCAKLESTVGGTISSSPSV